MKSINQFRVEKARIKAKQLKGGKLTDWEKRYLQLNGFTK